MKVLDLKQNTPEWEAFRKDKIGASDAATILGISPWSTPYQLWMEKKGGEGKTKSAAMQRGHDLEDEARTLFEKQTGIKTIPAVVQSTYNDFQIASLDGLCLQGETFVEIKVPNKEVMALAKEGKLPEHYMAQMQHQLFVADLQSAYYFVYDGRESHLVEVKRDVDFVEMLIEKEEAFYELMMGDEPPELTDRDYKYRNDEAWQKHASNFNIIDTEIKRLEANRCIEKQALIELAEGQNSKGGGVSVSHFFRKGSLDADKLAADLKIDLNKYRKKGSIVKMVSPQK